MSEMVRRVARVLARLDGRDPDDTDGGPCHMGLWLDAGEVRWTGYVDAAREVLAAMREPTEAMIEECSDAYGRGHQRNFVADWQAGIDAALAQPQTVTIPVTKP